MSTESSTSVMKSSPPGVSLSLTTKAEKEETSTLQYGQEQSFSYYRRQESTTGTETLLFYNTYLMICKERVLILSNQK